MQAKNYRIRIEPEKFYHIWNRGNNRENLFYSSRNYEYFIRIYADYLDPVVETYAFCLLPNHFHLLVQTKSIVVSPAGETTKTNTGKSNPVSLAFQRFFTAYSQAINVQERRTGSLFQKPFKRLELTSTRQLVNLTHYIHTNPQKHGIIDDFRQYPWSSYDRIMRDKPSKLKKDEVLQWFRNKENYVNYHARIIDLDELKDIIIE
jgi:putative transposase